MPHKVFESDLLRVPHGFWGRAGGVSPPPHDTLNCGFGSDDARENVVENRDRVQHWLGADAMQTCHQIHSDIVHRIDAPLPHRPEGDGLVTTTPGLAVAALAADCVPILFEDVGAGIVGACHAGWRGAVGGVIEATVAEMRACGATDIRAAVGPCIGPASFEVQDDFRETVLAADGNAADYFRHDEKLHFDLPRYVGAKLTGLDVEADICGIDTYCSPDRLFSYRLSRHTGQPDFGRNISAIVLPR